MGGQKNSWEKSETCLCRLPPLTSGQAAAAVSPLTGPSDGAFCCEQPSSPAHQRQPGLADPFSAGQLHCAAACCCLQSCGLLTRALRRTGNLLVSGQYQHHTPLSPSSLSAQAEASTGEFTSSPASCSVNGICSSLPRYLQPCRPPGFLTAAGCPNPTMGKKLPFPLPVVR